MRANQIILLMITDNEKWHYLAMKNLSALLSRIISKHDKDSHCLNCLHSFSTKNKLKGHKNVCKNHYYGHIEMPKRDKNILKQLCWHRAFTWKINTCHSNPKKLSTTKIHKHTASGYWLLMHCSFDVTKNNHDYFRGENCMKTFSEYLKNNCNKNNKIWKEEMTPLTNE